MPTMPTDPKPEWRRVDWGTEPGDHRADRWRQFGEDVSKEMDVNHPLYVMYLSGYDERALANSLQAFPCSRSENSPPPQANWQLFNGCVSNWQWPMLEVLAGHPLNKVSLGRLHTVHYTVAEKAWEAIKETMPDQLPANVAVQRFLHGWDARRLAQGSWALYDPDQPWSWCSCFGPTSWLRVDDETILVVLDAESG